MTSWRRFGAVWVSAGIFITAGGSYLWYGLRGQSVAETLAAAGERRAVWLMGYDVPEEEAAPDATNAIEVTTEYAGVNVVTDYFATVTLEWSGSHGALVITQGASNEFRSADFSVRRYVRFGKPSGVIDNPIFKVLNVKVDGTTAGSVYVVDNPYLPYVEFGEETGAAGARWVPGQGVQLGTHYSNDTFAVWMTSAPSNRYAVTTQEVYRTVYAYKGLALGDRMLGGTLDARLFPAVRRLCGAWLLAMGWFDYGRWLGWEYGDELRTRDNVWWCDPRWEVPEPLELMRTPYELVRDGELHADGAACTVDYYGAGGWESRQEYTRKAWAMKSALESEPTDFGELVWTLALRTPQMATGRWDWTSGQMGNRTNNLPVAARVAQSGVAQMDEAETHPGATNATGCAVSWWESVGNGTNMYAFARELHRRGNLTTGDFSQVNAALRSMKRTVCFVPLSVLTNAAWSPWEEAREVERDALRSYETNATGEAQATAPAWAPEDRYGEWRGAATATATNAGTANWGEFAAVDSTYGRFCDWQLMRTNGTYYYAHREDTAELTLHARGTEVKGLRMPHPAVWAITNGLVARVRVYAAAAAEMQQWVPEESFSCENHDGIVESVTWMGGGAQSKASDFGGTVSAAGALPGTRAQETFTLSVEDGNQEYCNTGKSAATDDRGASCYLAHTLTKVLDVSDPETEDDVRFDFGTAAWDWTGVWDDDPQAAAWLWEHYEPEGPPEAYYPENWRKKWYYTRTYKSTLRVLYFVVVTDWKWKHMGDEGYVPEEWTPAWAGE